MKSRIPDFVSIITEEKGGTFPFRETVQMEDVSLSCSIVKDVLRVQLTADTSPLRYVKLRWAFAPDEKRSDAVKVYGDVWERGYGDLEWRGIVPDRMMPWVCAVSNGSDQVRDVTGRYTECFGVKTQPKALCMWQYDPAGITLWLDVRCGGVGVILQNRTLEVCDVLFEEYREVSAFDALRAYYKKLCDAPLTVDHKVYGTNNWYYAYGETSHEEVLADTKLLMDSCAGLENRPYMVLDDGWQKNNCDAPWNLLREGKFHDMKELAAQISAMGARPGLWIRPLSDMHFEVTDASSDWRLQRDNAILDPSHPEVLQYVAGLMEMVCDWGYTLIKHDYSTYDIFGYWADSRKKAFADDGWAFWNRNKTTAEVILDLYRVIYTATKGRALILGCNVIGHLAAGLVHLNRTGDDTSGRDWDRTRKFGVNTLAFRMLHHNAFFLADADCVGIMGKIDWSLNREWLSAVAHSGTPLFVSPKPGIMSPAELDELKEAYRINSVQADTLVPLDWMESTNPEKWLLNGVEQHYRWYAVTGQNTFFRL